MGLLGGLVLAFLLEFVDRRVRSAEDLLNADGVPVLGVLSERSGRAAFVPRLAFNRRRIPPMPPLLTLDGRPQ